MNINCSNNIINTNTKAQPVKTSKEVSFKGATKAFEKQAFYDPQILQASLGINNKNGVVGAPPMDVVHLIEQSSSSKQEVEKKVKAFMNSISDASKILKEAEKEGLKNLEELDFEAYMDEYNSLPPFRAASLYKSKYDVSSLDEDALKKSHQMLLIQLKKRLKK